MNEELKLVGGPRDGDVVIAKEFVPDKLAWTRVTPDGIEEAHYKRVGESLTFEYVDNNGFNVRVEHVEREHKPRGFMLRVGRFNFAVFFK